LNTRRHERSLGKIENAFIRKFLMNEVQDPFEFFKPLPNFNHLKSNTWPGNGRATYYHPCGLLYENMLGIGVMGEMGKRRYHNLERSLAPKGVTYSKTMKPHEGKVLSCKGTST